MSINLVLNSSSFVQQAVVAFLTTPLHIHDMGDNNFENLIHQIYKFASEIHVVKLSMNKWESTAWNECDKIEVNK
jgi:hypothetical protein